MATKTAEKQNIPKLVKASARGLHIAPRKMRLVTNLINGMRASEAVTQLEFTNKKASKFLSRLIRTAVADAENNFSLKAEDMYVKSVTCDMGQTMKRYFPRARGSAFVIRRKQSHVNVILEERPGKSANKKARAVLKTDKKTETTQTVEGNIGKPEAEQAAPEIKQVDAKQFEAPKSNEQVKMNKVQQKRRLFNRKTGE